MKMYFHLYPDVLLLAVAIDKTERFLAHLLPYRRSVLIRLPQQLLINTFSTPPRFGKRSSLRVGRAQHCSYTFDMEDFSHSAELSVAQ
mmetsp:Transcript_21165/g.30759  ORF Transcript_21165/g.30759 Transcript_21165/m.30759 type:complete len:88 (+) Transcript_21165:135-398(+)